MSEDLRVHRSSTNLFQQCILQAPLPTLLSAAPQIVVVILDCISITIKNTFKKVAAIEEMKKADIHHGEKKDHISSCSCELDSKRNSFSILQKSQSTEYKKNVKTIMLQGADVFWHVHLRLSTIRYIRTHLVPKITVAERKWRFLPFRKANECR
jgi:hypothetical protein